MGNIQTISLGTQVTSKKTGYPVVGRIVGVQTPELYCQYSSIQPKDCTRWNDLYPDWIEKPVVVVKFNKPQKTCTMDELKLYYPDASEYELKEQFEMVPVAPWAAYPIDDLEVME